MSSEIATNHRSHSVHARSVYDPLLLFPDGDLPKLAEIGGLFVDMVRTICSWVDELVPDSPHRPHAGLVTFVADRPGHDRRYAIDSSRVRHEMGWRPTLDLHEGLGRTVRWYLENRWWWQGIREGGFEDRRRQGRSAATACAE